MSSDKARNCREGPDSPANGSGNGSAVNSCMMNENISLPGQSRSKGSIGRSRHRGSKKATPIAASSVASSDNGSITSTIDAKSDEASHQLSSKKKKHGRRRRKPKMHDKVDSVDSYDPCGSGPSAAFSKGNKKYTFGWNTNICPASKGGPTSKKHHDAPMMKRDLYFSLHCDRVAIGGKSPSTPDHGKDDVVSSKSEAVARVTLMNWENETILNTFVQVPLPVIDFYDTGIDANDVSVGSASAQVFAAVRQKVESTLKGKILVGHNVERHLSSLGLSHPWTDTRDCAKFFEEYLLKSNNSKQTYDSLSLEILCKDQLCRSLPPNGHAERPSEICIAAMDMYKKHRKAWEEFLIAEARKNESQREPPSCDSLQHQQGQEQLLCHHTMPSSFPMARERLGSSDGINNNVVALQCVMVGTVYGSHSLGRVTIMNSSKETLWDVFVQVNVTIVYSDEVGILQQDVSGANGAISLPLVRRRVEQLLRGNLVVGYKVDESLRALGLVYPPTHIRDVAYFRPFMYAEMDGISGTAVIVERSLDELSLEILQKPLAPARFNCRSSDICSTVLDLYNMYSDLWEREIFMQLHEQDNARNHMYQSYAPRMPQSKQQSSWFGWGKRNQADLEAAPVLPQYQIPVAPNVTTPSAALSPQAFQALHDDVSTSPLLRYQGSSSCYEGSSYMEGSSAYGDSSYYDPAATSAQDDSSQGYPETFRVDSFVSSVDELTSGTLKVDADTNTSTSKTSSWFRLGSKKSRYVSSSSRVSMDAVQEQSDEQPSVSVGHSAIGISSPPHSLYSVDEQKEPSSIDAPASRSWFGFGRRSLSPNKMESDDAMQDAARQESPESPRSDPTAATMESEVATPTLSQVSTDTSIHTVEMALSTTAVNQVISPLGETNDYVDLTEQPKNSYVWFGFRRQRSQHLGTRRNDEPSEILANAESISELASEPDVMLSAHEKTDTADDDWIQEVVSQSTDTGPNDDMNSVSLASFFDSDVGNNETITTENQSSRGQSFWFGFKRSKIRKASGLAAVSDAAEENESGNEAEPFPDNLPDSVSFNHAREDSFSHSHLGVSWCLDDNKAVASTSAGQDDSLLSRSRLPTESTVPSVLTEEDDSGEAFTEEFEKGIAQSFAYLEI